MYGGKGVVINPCGIKSKYWTEKKTGELNYEGLHGRPSVLKKYDMGAINRERKRSDSKTSNSGSCGKTSVSAAKRDKWRLKLKDKWIFYNQNILKEKY